MTNETGARPLYDPMIIIQVDSFTKHHIVRVIKKRKYFGGKELQRYTLHGGKEDLNKLVVEFIEDKKIEFNIDPANVKIVRHEKPLKR